MLSSPAWLRASEQIDYKSPDGKFAQRETLTELNPVHGDTAIIETGTNKVAVQLTGDEPYGRFRIVLIPFGNF